MRTQRRKKQLYILRRFKVRTGFLLSLYLCFVNICIFLLSHSLCCRYFFSGWKVRALLIATNRDEQSVRERERELKFEDEFSVH